PAPGRGGPCLERVGTGGPSGGHRPSAGPTPPVRQVARNRVRDKLQSANASLEPREDDQLHELRLAESTRLQMAEFVVDAGLPAVQDVHREVLETGNRQLDGVVGFGAGLLEPSTKGTQSLVEVARVIRP